MDLFLSIQGLDKLTVFDWSGLVIIVIAALLGLKRGIFVELIRFFGYAVCFLIAIYGYEKVSGQVLKTVSIFPEPLVQTIVFGFLFWASFIVVHVIFLFFSFTGLITKNIFGRLLGMLMGVLKGIILITIIVVNVALLQNENLNGIIGSSYTGKYILPAVEKVLEILDTQILKIPIASRHATLRRITYSSEPVLSIKGTSEGSGAREMVSKQDLKKMRENIDKYEEVLKEAVKE